MYKFVRKHQVPPGGKYFYCVPETGVHFDSLSGWQDLLTKVRLHYALNKLVVPENLAELIEDYICKHVPDGFCYGDGGVKSLFRRLTFWQIERRSRDLARNQRFTDQRDAEHKASVCLSCTYNMRHLCTSCNGLRSILKALCRGRSTVADDFLGVCALTGCFIPVMVQLIDKAIGFEGERPENCWLLDKSA